MATINLACDESSTRFKEPLTFCGFLVPSTQVNSLQAAYPLLLLRKRLLAPPPLLFR